MYHSQAPSVNQEAAHLYGIPFIVLVFIRISSNLVPGDVFCPGLIISIIKTYFTQLSLLPSLFAHRLLPMLLQEFP